MAKKFTFQGLPAYQEGPFAVMKRDDKDGLWYVYHIKSGRLAMGTVKADKQKKPILALATALTETNIDWDFETEKEMGEMNTKDFWEELRAVFDRFN